MTRRSLGGLLPALVAFPTAALAADLKKDCIKDCVSNCNRVAPGNKAYCVCAASENRMDMQKWRKPSASARGCET